MPQVLLFINEKWKTNSRTMLYSQILATSENIWKGSNTTEKYITLTTKSLKKALRDSSKKTIQNQTASKWSDKKILSTYFPQKNSTTCS